MDESFTVTVSTPDADAVVGAALIGRAAGGRIEALVFDSEGLVRFFEQSVQEKLPRAYELVLCGPVVTRRDWDGRLIRPRLMDSLRAFMGPIRWFSARRWEPEDVSAVGHLIGVENLVISEIAGSVAMMVKDRYFEAGDEREDSLARFAAGHLTQEEEQGWGAKLRKVLIALKADYYELAGAVGPLIENRIQDLIDKYADRAEQTDEDNRRFAHDNAGEPTQMGEMKLVFFSLPRPRHPFWAEISEHAREATGAELSLCRLQGRPVMLLSRDADVRADLRVWARYVTDLLPGARSVGAQPDVVPLVIDRLAEDPGLHDEVLSLMKDGAHLLRN